MNNESRSGQHLDDEPCMGARARGATAAEQPELLQRMSDRLGRDGRKLKWPATEAPPVAGTYHLQVACGGATEKWKHWEIRVCRHRCGRLL